MRVARRFRGIRTKSTAPTAVPSAPLSTVACVPMNPAIIPPPNVASTMANRPNGKGAARHTLEISGPAQRLQGVMQKRAVRSRQRDHRQAPQPPGDRGLPERSGEREPDDEDDVDRQRGANHPDSSEPICNRARRRLTERCDHVERRPNRPDLAPRQPDVFESEHDPQRQPELQIVKEVEPRIQTQVALPARSEINTIETWAERSRPQGKRSPCRGDRERVIESLQGTLHRRMAALDGLRTDSD